jgi:pimeloyl-ACP methyl ester carboxylesterase
MWQEVLRYLVIFLINFSVTFPSILYHGVTSKYNQYTMLIDNTLPPGFHDVVVFVHGIDGSPVEFKTMMRELKNRNIPYKMMTVDFGSNAGKTINEEIDIINQTLQAQWTKIKTIHFVGVSKGGVDCLSYVKKYPQKVKSIITISSPVNGSKIALYQPLYPMASKELGYGADTFKDLITAPPQYKLFHIVPTWDHLIQPTECAKTQYGRTYTYTGYYSHVGIMYAPEVINIVHNELVTCPM